MSLNINKNFGAISNGALTSLNSHQTAMGKAITRVSTGMRVNSPADDVSAYVTSRKIKADSDGYTALYNGLQSGSAKLNAADSAVSSVLDILNAMKSKALEYQAADSDDQSNVKSEYDNLFKVLGSAMNVQYNGKSILKDGVTMSLYTSMYNDVDIGTAASSYSKDSLKLSSNPSSNDYAKVVTSGGEAVGGTASETGKFVYMNTTYSIASDSSLNTASTGSFFVKSGGNNVGIISTAGIDWFAGHYASKAGNGITPNTYDLSSTTGLVKSGSDYVGKLGNNDVVGIIIDGTSYTLDGFASDNLDDAYVAGVLKDGNDKTVGVYDYSSATGKLAVFASKPQEVGKIDVNMGGIVSEVTGLNDVTSSDIVDNIKTAIENITTQQAALNAGIGAMEYATSYLSNAANAQDLAYTSITEADMAKEMTSYVKNNVMAQAAQAMIAQANQSMASVLNLLQ